MKDHRYILAFLTILMLINVSLIAQEKELVIRYNFERGVLELGGKNNSEIIKKDLPAFYVNVYDYGYVSIRETEPSSIGKFLPSGVTTLYDTIYNYVKVDYIKAHLLKEYSVENNNKILLKEPLNLFEWKLGKETKTILGYHCTKATCTFRGRDYVAYFTREIPFKAAPWKFYGLPGVILEVYSTDDFCRWTALSLKIRPHITKIDLPFYGLKTFNLEQYVEYLKKKRQRYIEIYKKNVLNFPDNQSAKNRLEELKLNLPKTIEIFDLE